MNIMRISRRLSVFVSLTMSLFMSNIPSLALAEGMISTVEVVHQLSRAEAQSQLENFVNRSDVREELVKRGLSQDEISSRLASLSTDEMRQLSTQVEQAKAGGDILVTVLLVVLIIYLIKRI